MIMDGTAKTSKPATAERIYEAFRLAAASADDITLPAWNSLTSDQGRPWFSVVAAKAQIAGEPTDTKVAYTYDLETKIEPRMIRDEFMEQDGSEVEDDGVVLEDLPTSLAIRAMVAGDLCLPECDLGTGAFNTAIRAKVHEVDLDVYEDRIDPADAEAANLLMHDATGHDAWRLMRATYTEAGGVYAGAGVHAWRAAALELLAEEAGNHYLLQCRTPGVGELKIGPFRVKHNRVYDDVSEETTEWDGRLMALSLATKSSLGVILGMRIEDATRAWSCYERLKKKADLRALSIVAARLYSTSTDGGGKTSSPSPSTS